jgi:hypothetical protein
LGGLETEIFYVDGKRVENCRAWGIYQIVYTTDVQLGYSVHITLKVKV